MLTLAVLLMPSVETKADAQISEPIKTPVTQPAAQNLSEQEPIQVRPIILSVEPEPTVITMSVPDENSGQKTFMDYHTITDKTSVQYALQQNAVTDTYGLRKLNDCYLIAMGSYYGNPGDKLRITLTSGYQFDAILGDIKADKDTDETNRHRNGNIVEFIADTEKLSQQVWYHGDISYAAECFQGAIANIEKYPTA